MKELANKVAIVTGASKGIGAATAKSLAAEGAHVIVNYASSKSDAEKVVSDIVATGGTAMAIRGDVSKTADVNAMVDATIKAYGRIDILVNNSGIYDFVALEDITEGHFHTHFNINVLGILLVIQAALKYLGEGASIINISSVVTSTLPAGSAVYTGTKGAVDVITGVLARELGPKKIRVNAVSPGMVVTEETHRTGVVGSELETQVIKVTPLGRTGYPNDIAPVITFLASDDAHWVTGERILVSGGYR